MTIDELLARLRSLGARLILDGDRLRVDAPRGALTPELQEAIRSRRTELVALLGGRGGSVPSAMSSTPVGAGPAPLSYAQERLWLFQTIDPDATAYNLTPVVRLLGRLEVDRLASAARQLLERHEPLRTVFRQESAGVVQQQVLPAPAVEIAVEDVAHLSAGGQEEALRALVRREQRRPFDLSREIPFRLVLLRRSNAEHDLIGAFHHIAVDGTSIDIVFRDLMALYGEIALEPLPLRFADYANWERHHWSEELLQSEVGFWTGELAGAPLTLDLPTDRPRPGTIRFTGGVVSWCLDREVSNRLRALLREEHSSLFMAVLAAFAAALHAETGQRDVIIGTATSGRNRAEVKPLVGMFVNQIPLRVQVQRGTTFRELLRSARAVALRGFEHQDVPFSKVIDALDPPRDASRTPVFQVLLNVLPPAATEIGRTSELVCLSPDAAEITHLFDRQSSYELTLYGRQIGEDIQLELLYNAELFDAPRAEGLLDSIRTCLLAGAHEPERALEDVLLAAAFPADGGLAGPDPATEEESVTARFHRIAAAHAERPAVLEGETELTYRELNARIEDIARRIAARTTDFATPVGVLVPQEPVLVEAILGVLRSGRPYVPLDASYPAERLAFMIRDSGADLLLTTPGLRAMAEAFVEGSIPVIATGEAAPIELPLPAPPRPDAIAYLLYTSGSTGQPKAVLQSHGNLVRQADRYARALSILPEDRLALMASISFDASLMDLFGALLNGASVCPIDPRATDLSRLPQLLTARRLSIMHVTPTVFRTVRHTAADATFPTVRAVDLGGEALRPEDVAYFDQAFAPDAVLVNSYGPSEHTLALAYLVPRSLRSNEVSIGRPVGDVEVVLLDEAGEVDLVRGELVLASRYGALGYWGRPELTAAAFGQHARRPGWRTYRTGDIARRRRDGSYVFLERRDGQLKIRGHRVEPTEVESVLRAHPAVAEVAVHGPTGPGGTPVLTGCISWVEGAEPSIRSLAEWCGARLPGYMVPTAWVSVDALPRTPTGKVDRLALPTAAERTASTAGRVEPRTPEEEILAQIWTEVLGTQDFGVFDDFFSLGGHSLTATQVVARVREVLRVEIPFRQFFDAPTIAGAAAWLRERARPEVTIPPLLPCANGDAPLSFSQERMWFIHEMARQSAAYNIPAAILLEGKLDRQRLIEAVQTLVDQQEALQTRIEVIRGVPRQVVGSRTDWQLVEEDFSDRQQAEALELAQTHAATHLAQPYDLARGPLFRVILSQVSPEQHLLSIGAHHIISDMWSFGLMGRSIAAAYSGRPADQKPPVSYRDYAVWQRAWLHGEALEAQVSYWRDRLAGITTLELPTDFTRPPFYTFGGERLQVPLKPELRAAIERLSVSTRVTPFMVLLGAMNALLHAYTRQSDVAVGVPIANRTHTATEQLVGTFVNTLVHRNQLEGDPTVRELLGRVRETALDAYAHQDAPFELLVKELKPTRDPSRSPLFQVLFNVGNVGTGGIEFEGLSGRVIQLQRYAAQLDLAVHVGINALESEVALTYNSSLFSRRTAERMLAHYVCILERAVKDPDMRLADLCAISAEDADTLLRSWNETARDYPAATSVPALLAVAALRTPDRVAVSSPTGSFTYRELLDYAQRITAALVAAGVRPGDRVAILMERSREMLGALLGILGSGAAYVPVDPSYPEARVRYVLEDSAARLVVTHRGLERRLGLETTALDLDRWAPPAPAPFVAVQPPQAAYAIYTSGSTGKPKGVEVSHGAMVNFLRSMQERPGITPADNLLAVTTISFDIAVLELYLPLISGACVVIASEDDALDGHRLMQRMEEHDITLMQATPATWKLLIAAGWAGRPALRILCGGEPLSRALADDLLGRSAELWNMYGPTETTVWSTIERVEAEGPILIGRPIANTTVYVLGETLELRPIGVPGELWIGGAGVANGYVNRPDLTAERFLDSPFRGGERIYRTGDLVRWRHDGRLEHMGRLDHQVKIRGFRIELGEVEAALLAHEAVHDAVVSAREDRLVGYVVLEPGRSATQGELRTFVGTTLPPYMVPSLIVTMDALPLTPNGKVDRKQLPDPVESPVEAAPPQLPEEGAARVIAEVWAELVGSDRVALSDNFFEIGGHSLLAMQAVAMIEERTGHRIEPRALFFKSLGELADGIPSEVLPA